MVFEETKQSQELELDERELTFKEKLIAEAKFANEARKPLLENNKITIDDISDSYVFSSKLVHNLVPKYIPNVDTAIMEAYKKDFVEDVRITRTFMFALENYKIGEIYEGIVTKIMDYGCFVKIEDGVEGLIHNSELDWTNRNIKPNKIITSKFFTFT